MRKKSIAIPMPCPNEGETVEHSIRKISNGYIHAEHRYGKGKSGHKETFYSEKPEVGTLVPKQSRRKTQTPKTPI